MEQTQTNDLTTNHFELKAETAWADQAFHELADIQDGDIFFDVDLSIFDGEFCDLEFNPNLDQSAGVIRPGTFELFAKLMANGNRIHLWSRRSKIHAEGVAEIYGFKDMIAGFHNKGIRTLEDGSLQATGDVFLEDVVKETGITPAATVDNDPLDRIIDAPAVRFVEVEDFNARVRRPALTAA